MQTVNQLLREHQSRMNQLEAKIPVIIKSSQTMTFGSVPANSTVERTVNVRGITTNSIPVVSPRASLGATPFIWSAYIATANVVIIRILNPTGSPATPNNVPWNISITQG